MQIFRQDASGEATPLRRKLLGDTLFEYLRSRADATEASVMADDLAAGSETLFLGLGALPPKRDAAHRIFLGLTAAPQKMLGRNTLVCLRPLAEELEALAARQPGLAEASAMWCGDVLANFDCCVFVEYSDYRASVGFEPWIPLHMAQGFPVLLGLAPPPKDTPPVCVFVHSSEDEVVEDAQTACAALEVYGDVIMVTSQTAPPEQVLEPGGIHLHFGYSRFRTKAVLTPYDSLANGNYCIVFSASEKLSDNLLKHIGLRSYAEVLSDPDDLVSRVRKIKERVSSFNSAGLRFNPEIARFNAMNHQIFESAFADVARELGL